MMFSETRAPRRFVMSFAHLLAELRYFEVTVLTETLVVRAPSGLHQTCRALGLRGCCQQMPQRLSGLPKAWRELIIATVSLEL